MSYTKEQAMSNNKQLMYMVGELAIVAGVVFWFSSKTKKLSSYIEELSQRLEDQEDHIQKLETNIANLNNIVSQLLRQQEVKNVQEVRKEKVIERKKEKPRTESKAEPKIVIQPKNVSFVNKIEAIEEEEENFSDSDIDDEIRTELQELDLDTSLKKQE